MRLLRTGLLACLCALPVLAHAGMAASNFCDRQDKLSAADQDRLLRFAAVVRRELGDGASGAALISRSGLDLARFHIRYSHAALAQRGAAGAWSARQLYFACDESRPRIFDQGVAGFAMGTDDPALGYISIVRLPAEAAAQLQLALIDNQRALALLAERYSANAYAFGLAYQNCNQWVIEMLASAFGALPAQTGLRAQAQAWLRAKGYDPAPVTIDSPFVMMASYAVPLLHLGDHPRADRAARRLQISLPSTVEAFIQQRLPQAERVEICHNAHQIVLHRGWTPVPDGCMAQAGDEVLPLD